MKKKEIRNSLCLISRALVIPVFTILLAVLLAGQNTNAQDSPVYEKPVVREKENVTGDLCSISAVRRFLMNRAEYPDAALHAGKTGTIELYARINNEGRVNEILVLQPVRDYVEVDEIIITENAPAGKEITESTRHESLVAESRRALMELPKLDIQEIYGETLKITFKFVLR